MKQILLALFGTALFGCRTPIDRETVVMRHDIVTCATDPRSPAQVGNGGFAFGMDITGLQTFEPFNTLSDWSWHSFPQDQTTRQQHYRGVPVAVGGRCIYLDLPDETQPGISDWLAKNPHRFNLGRLGFRLLKTDGSEATENDLHDVSQHTELWSGIVTSRFSLEGIPVEVRTACHPDRDAIGVEITSPLLKEGRLQLFLDFPYADDRYITERVGDYDRPERHNSMLLAATDTTASIRRSMDTVVYQVALRWDGAPGRIVPPGNESHRFILQPGCSNRFSMVCEFSPDTVVMPLPTMAELSDGSARMWREYWLSGAAIDLSESEDSRWRELERRIILSQRLLRLNGAGRWPPQESGLVNNGWHGRFHFEMIWWHELHFLLWGRPELAEKALGIYRTFLPTSQQRAARQGMRGARWPKCTADRDAEWPHLIHATLIWQQPHPIYLAETLYRLAPTEETLSEWRDVVFATAEYMADVVRPDTLRGVYVLGPPLCPVSENTPIFETRNPTFELAYWRYGLQTAQIWRERSGLPRNSHWDDVLERLAPLPIEAGTYVTCEGIPDMWSRYNFEHPALAGIYGMLPGAGVDRSTFERTLDRIFDTWKFDRVWGWDFPMLAMAAARCGRPGQAVEMLLYDSENFQFDVHGLATGGPFPYFPSNGGLLTAVAMMAGGWEGSEGPAPGFPERWHVKAEGFQKMQ